MTEGGRSETPVVVFLMLLTKQNLSVIKIEVFFMEECWRWIEGFGARGVTVDTFALLGRLQQSE